MSNCLIFVDGGNGRMGVDEFVSTDERSETNELFALETGGMRVKEKMTLAREGEHSDQIGQMSSDRRQSETTKRRIDLFAKFLLGRFQSVEEKRLVRLLIMVGNQLVVVRPFAVQRKDLLGEIISLGQLIDHFVQVGNLRWIFQFGQTNQFANGENRSVQRGHRQTIGDQTQFELHLFLSDRRLNESHRRCFFVSTGQFVLSVRDHFVFDFSTIIIDDRVEQIFFEDESI